MRRTASTTHTLYPAIPTHRRATATCYHCGHSEVAAHLLWVRQSPSTAYRALCATCAPRYVPEARAADGVERVPRTLPAEEEVMGVLARADRSG